MPGSSSAPATRPPWRKLSTYTAGSLVATGCSELALLICYGMLHLSPAVSSVVAWVCGAVPNYLLNRRWTWQRTGRPDPRRELLPYVAIILATLGLAVVVTRAVDAALAESGAGARTTLVAASFLGVYVVMFLARYLLLDRMFTRLDTSPTVSGEARLR
jgi:putative flippase GtrA